MTTHFPDHFECVEVFSETMDDVRLCAAYLKVHPERLVEAAIQTFINDILDDMRCKPASEVN
jgi:hypothetical protein